MKLSFPTLLLPLSIVFLCSISAEMAADENRFVITVNGKKGFINTMGEVVIDPQFQDASEFSEGLCAVRIEGRYGFIDTKGKFRIPAVYDYATIFKEGMALVYLDGKPRFITQTGELAFNANYPHMSHFEKGRSTVRTQSEKMGTIDRHGVLVVDTVYSFIKPIDDGLAIVYGPEHREYTSGNQKRNFQVSVIDSSAIMLFPYGKFVSIEDYSEGYFRVYFPEGKRSKSSTGAIVDRSGEVVFSLSKNKDSWISGNVHNGIVRVTLPIKRNISENYDAYLDLKGNEIYSKKSTYTGSDFKDNVAFVGDEDFKYILINRKGEVISNEKFGIPCCSDENPFENGLAVVEFSDETWGVIDTTAQTLLKTSYKRILPERLIQGQYLFFIGDEADSTGGRFGLINLQGKLLIPPIMQDFDRRGFVNDLLKASVSNRITYFNRDGQMTWQDVHEQRDLAPLNIDYMNRGYFYANYNYTGHPAESSHSEPNEVPKANAFPRNSLTIIAYPDSTDVAFLDIAKGFRIDVANTTTDTLIFNAQDNRLYMKMQAKDKYGNWQDIEYLPSSWCGNSYHSVDLPPRQYWTFVAPVYEGIIPTTLRIALTYLDPSHTQLTRRSRRHHYQRSPELTVYSNEFPGSINPAQFWRRPDYAPYGIMDPYVE